MTLTNTKPLITLTNGYQQGVTLSLLLRGRTVRSRRIHLTWHANPYEGKWEGHVPKQEFLARKPFKFDEVCLIIVSPQDGQINKFRKHVGMTKVSKGDMTTIVYDNPCAVSLDLY